MLPEMPTWPAQDVARQVAALTPPDGRQLFAAALDPNPVEAMLREIVSRENALLERACRTALARGVGVLVVPGYTPMPTEMVPSREIYHFPDLDAVRRWIEDGCSHA